MASKLEIKQILFDNYDGFADKRFKKLERDVPFVVDDRSDRDFDARGQFFSWYCQMFATVEDVDRVRLEFRGGIPYSAAVSKWFAEHGANERPGDDCSFASVVLTPENFGDLLDLACQYSAITKGQYPVKAWKYVVPRTAASLRKLHRVLSTVWR